MLSATLLLKYFPSKLAMSTSIHPLPSGTGVAFSLSRDRHFFSIKDCRGFLNLLIVYSVISMKEP